MSVLIGNPANMNPVNMNPAYLKSESPTTAISSPLPSATECVDAWILIGGDRPDHETWQQLVLTLDWVYLQLLAMGTPENDIYYLVADIGEELS
ncbi:MAG: hypothetical protein E4G98_06855 [Promethearchaeota archaeon]|nr:MAG: hypothetical protein E4G98_06855 [Candidatus Lokiarchaeota archaeon]